MIPFTHLHVHSQYSVLDGQASISALVDKAIADGMRGIAITDHGNMFGIKEFFNYVKKKNSGVNDAIKSLKKELEKIGEGEPTKSQEEIEAEIEETKKKLFIPIIGCEMYVAEGDMHEHVSRKDTGRHLVVLAKNEKGYHNLIKIVSKAWTEGFYQHPRIDKKHLEQYHEGLIICSACLGGELPRLIQEGKINEAREAAKWYKSVWGNDYYLELQRHKATVPNANHEVYPAQIKVNEVLMQIAKELDIKVVCTNDVHFVNEEDAEAHDRLICVSTGKLLSDTSRMLYSKQEWMKTTEEMNELFADIPEAIANTNEVLDKIELYSIDHAPILPNFPLPDGFTNNDDYLRYLVYEGAKKIWGELDDEHIERLDFELETIKKMGFPGYFLIVQDFIAAARKMGVSVGPGRGSAAGSAVAYCLGITKIDPIKYDLLFERFLNPDRISLPDIDIDFDDDGRADVLKYVTRKYGEEKVAHIITYGAMAAKSAIKDVARVQNLSIAESNRLANMIPKTPNAMPKQPNGKAMAVTISNCVKCFPEFRDEYNSPDPNISTTLHYAEALEGNVRNTGVHACGVIIGRDDITDWVPVSTAEDKDRNKQLVTQYEGSVIEDTGLIKMDFLGLKTLSIIKEAVENIKHTRGIDLDIDNIDINDPATYQLYCKGKTTGTFQFESAGMQKYLKELKPSTFEDLIAMNALYRPGPMSYIPQFIARKHGQEPISYDIPIMEKYLKDTYGITVYQEQVMLLSRLLAGFTRGESDALRKAMGKKLIDKLASLKPKFLNGGRERGYDETVLEKIWGDWEHFASYAFNKSHATCYSWVAFQTAYLKANYPAEYMAAVLSRNFKEIDTLAKFIDECRALGIKVKGPDINESYRTFSVNSHGEIRFGLEAIKGVGSNTVAAIIDERNANGPFKTIFDFVERVNLTACNRKNIEALAQSGAFDTLSDISRDDFFGTSGPKNEPFTETLVKYGQRYKQDKLGNANSLFGDFDSELTQRPEIPHNYRLNEMEKLEMEKELVGMYFSAHPLDDFFMEITYGCNVRMADFRTVEGAPNKEITFGGLIVSMEEKSSQSGNKFGIIRLEDFSGVDEVRFFGNEYVAFKNFLEPGNRIIIKAKYMVPRYDAQGRLYRKIMSVNLLEEVKDKILSSITIDLTTGNFDDTLIDDLLKFKAEPNTGGSLKVRLFDPGLKRSIILSSDIRLMLSRQLLELLNDNDVPFTLS